MFQQVVAAASEWTWFKDPMVKMLFIFTLVLIAFGILIAVLVYKFKNDKFGDFKKTGLGIVIGYALAVIVIMSFLTFSDVDAGFATKDGFVPLLFYPILSALLVAVAGALAVWTCSLFSKKAVRIAGITTGVAEIGAFIALMVCMTKFYEWAKNDPNYANETWIDFSTVNNVGLIVSGVVFILVVAVIYFLGNKHKEENNTRSIVYGAIAIALSFALSYIRFLRMPQSGSITLASLLPLMIYCCMFGTRRGVIACLVYGMLQAIQDPFILHPMQFLLDYPLAFGVIAVSGIFVEKNVFKFKGGKILGFVLGGMIAVVLRYICHVCSGVFAFASYSGADTYGAILVYSLGYNSFAFLDMLISLVAGAIMFASKAFSAQMARSTSHAQVVDGLDDDEDDTAEDALIFTVDTEAKNTAAINESQAGQASDANVEE